MQGRGGEGKEGRGGGGADSAGPETHADANLLVSVEATWTKEPTSHR